MGGVYRQINKVDIINKGFIHIFSCNVTTMAVNNEEAFLIRFCRFS